MANGEPTRPRIRGLVAKLLNDREVAINRGEDDRVEVGQRFVILADNGPDIIDPETNESLGPTTVAATVVKIVRVEGPHLAVGRTFRRVGARAGWLNQSLIDQGAVSAMVGTPGHQERLPVDVKQPFQETSQPTIHVGSRVVETIGDEYDSV